MEEFNIFTFDDEWSTGVVGFGPANANVPLLAVENSIVHIEHHQYSYFVWSNGKTYVYTYDTQVTTSDIILNNFVRTLHINSRFYAIYNNHLITDVVFVECNSTIFVAFPGVGGMIQEESCSTDDDDELEAYDILEQDKVNDIVNIKKLQYDPGMTYPEFFKMNCNQASEQELVQVYNVNKFANIKRKNHEYLERVRRETDELNQLMINKGIDLQREVIQRLSPLQMRLYRERKETQMKHRDDRNCEIIDNRGNAAKPKKNNNNNKQKGKYVRKEQYDAHINFPLPHVAADMKPIDPLIVDPAPGPIAAFGNGPDPIVEDELLSYDTRGLFDRTFRYVVEYTRNTFSWFLYGLKAVTATTFYGMCTMMARELRLNLQDPSATPKMTFVKQFLLLTAVYVFVKYLFEKTRLLQVHSAYVSNVEKLPQLPVASKREYDNNYKTTKCKMVVDYTETVHWELETIGLTMIIPTTEESDDMQADGELLVNMIDPRSINDGISNQAVLERINKSTNIGNFIDYRREEVLESNVTEGTARLAAAVVFSQRCASMNTNINNTVFSNPDQVMRLVPRSGNVVMRWRRLFKYVNELINPFSSMGIGLMKRLFLYGQFPMTPYTWSVLLIRIMMLVVVGRWLPVKFPVRLPFRGGLTRPIPDR